MLGPERVDAIDGVCEAESRWAGSLCRSAYTCDVVRKSDDEVVLELVGRQDYMRVRRRVTVRDSDPTVYIQAIIDNVDDRRRHFALWLHPSVHAGFAGAPSDSFVVEVEGKPKTIAFESVPPGPTFFHPTGPYWLAIDPTIGAAVALRFDAKQVQWLKLFRGGDAFYSMELTTRAHTFEPGESQTHRFAYTMLRGMTHINHARGLDFVQLDRTVSATDSGLALTLRRWTLESSSPMRTVVMIDGGKGLQRVGKYNLPDRGPQGGVLTFNVPSSMIDASRRTFKVTGRLTSTNDPAMRTFDQQVVLADDPTSDLQTSASRNNDRIKQLMREGAVLHERVAQLDQLTAVIESLRNNVQHAGLRDDELASELKLLLKYQQRVLGLLE